MREEEKEREWEEADTAAQSHGASEQNWERQKHRHAWREGEGEVSLLLTFSWSVGEHPVYKIRGKTLKRTQVYNYVTLPPQRGPFLISRASILEWSVRCLLVENIGKEVDIVNISSLLLKEQPTFYPVVTFIMTCVLLSESSFCAPYEISEFCRSVMHAFCHLDYPPHL